MSDKEKRMELIIGKTYQLGDGDTMKISPDPMSVNEDGIQHRWVVKASLREISQIELIVLLGHKFVIETIQGRIVDLFFKIDYSSIKGQYFIVSLEKVEYFSAKEKTEMRIV